MLNAFNDEAHQQVAIDFMKFWYLPETQLEFSRRGGDTAVTAALDAPGYDDLQPHFRAYKYMIRENRSRDFWHDPNYAEMLALQQEAWNGYIADVVTDAKAGDGLHGLQAAGDSLRRRPLRHRAVGGVRRH